MLAIPAKNVVRSKQYGSQLNKYTDLGLQNKMFSICEFCSTYPRLLDWQRNFGRRKIIRKQNTINSCSVFQLERNFFKVELWRPELSCELPSLPYPRFQHSAAWVSLSMSLSLGISLSMSMGLTLGEQVIFNNYKCHDLLIASRAFLAKSNIGIMI